MIKEIREVSRGMREEVLVHKSGPATLVHLSRYLVSQGRTVVLILGRESMLPIYRALAGMIFGSREEWTSLPPFHPGQTSSRDWGKRWAGLHFMHSSSRSKLLILPASNLVPRWPLPESSLRESLELAPGEEITIEMLLEALVCWGYERVSMVSRVGDISVRGDIVDVFSPAYDHPLRFEFFGDTIEEVRLFEAMSQRSLELLPKALLIPVGACLHTAGFIKGAEAKWRRLKISGQITGIALQELQNGLSESRTDIPPGMFYSECTGFEDWLAEDTVYLLEDSSGLRSEIEQMFWSWQEELEERGWPEQEVVRSMEEVRGIWRKGSRILNETLVMGSSREGIDLPEKEISTYEDIFWQPEARQRPWKHLLETLRRWQREKTQVVLSFAGSRSMNKFCRLAREEQLEISQDYHPEGKGLFAVVSALGRGMDIVWNQSLILPESVLQPRKAQISRQEKEKFKGLARYDELSDGDLLVHRDYGLGRFSGLTRLKVGSVMSDYLLVQFAREDKLYLPVDRLTLIQKYKGPEGVCPALDRLGGSGGSKTRSRVRKAIEKIAHDLVQMYAYRKVAKGFNYGPPNENFREFEAGFGFDETPDQEKAINEVLADMDRSEPMDRLVCGDVGFGKTEVAMRAAFKAVMDGRQVALLCPTTVLAEQHFQNFKRRMSEFPVNVALLSRFVPAARQKTVVQALKRGEIDIVIGTHRLLSKDVELPGQALLILDEEQRFGVKHKEKLKKMRQNIDVLTLSATPIPRTLQLSLSGIRSLSVIETAPVDRMPVKSALIERDGAALKAALKRELERGGQVFWVYNRVQGLDRVFEYVKELVPEARVGKAHGQMSAKVLEETMHSFWHQEIDVLVCTSIIESGLDFPKANTLIVDQAQMFGLGQLYQLRGRVGRSNVQAYSYFVVPDLGSISDLAKKRLKVILDMDYLGAGLHVAMEDLRLRGAGNLLGESQTGQIGRVGLDLFLEMLEEEVAKVKGEPPRDRIDPELKIGFTALIPDNYIPEAGQRLRYYKVLSGCLEESELDLATQEIEDRYGDMPDDMVCFVQVIRVKMRLRKLRVQKADLFPGRSIVRWGDSSPDIDPEKIIAWMAARSDTVRLLPPADIEITLASGQDVRSGLLETIAVLDSLLEQFSGVDTVNISL